MRGAPSPRKVVVPKRVVSVVLLRRHCMAIMPPMDTKDVLDQIMGTKSPLKRQLLAAALISGLLEERGASPPVVIGECALSYYSREVYFTADIDFACSDREELDSVLQDMGFVKRGRYWASEELSLAVEAPASALPGEQSPVEVVEFEGGLQCRIIGIEDLIIDRLNACRHWKSETDCELVELLVKRYSAELDWTYLEKKAAEPENDSLEELMKFKSRQGDEGTSKTV
jgi:hypothetical protein